MIITEYDAIQIRFGELWLKGENRGMFIEALYRNVSNAIRGVKHGMLAKERDSFMINLDKESELNKLLTTLSFLPGISWFSPVVIAKPSVDDIIRKANLFGEEAKGAVRVEAKRSYKGHRFTSTQLIGRMIKAAQSGKLKLDLDKYACNVLYINVEKGKTTLHLNKMIGIGGLPVGTSGRCIVLLSGGIDSPVAAFYAMKRGLRPIYLHFHTFPDNKTAMRSKIPMIIRMLSVHSNGAKIYYVPAHLFQAVVMKVPSKYELVLYKRFMYRVAEKIAESEGAIAIVTGESVGQVASQTIENMLASQEGIKPLILRPLTGFDKQEIIAKARELGTYNLSIEEYRDVCSIKIKRPATRTNAALISRLYRSCKLGAAEAKSLEASLSTHCQ